MLEPLQHGRTILFAIILGIIAAIALSLKLLADTAELRYQRDVTRMVFNNNLGVLRDIEVQSGVATDGMRQLLTDQTSGKQNQPYIVVSIADHRLWYKQGDSVLFTAPVATASGKELTGAGDHWRFETPRGRLTVLAKDENPAWVPPDWHFIEQSHKRDMPLVQLSRAHPVTVGGATYTVNGSDVIKQYPDGRTEVVPPPTKESSLLTAGGEIIVPPIGTNQRRYMDVLGTRRLDLGDGYGIHGTNEPGSVGHSVSHGCVRMYNSDVEQLYPMVAVGTPVYIY